MSTKAIAAKNTQIKIGSTAIIEVTSINGLNMKADTVEVTALNNGGWKEFIKTLKDAGELALELNYVPTDATHKNAAGGLLYAFNSDSTDEYSLIFPDTAATTWTFDGLVTAFNVNAAKDSNLKLSCTIKATGAPTLA